MDDAYTFLGTSAEGATMFMDIAIYPDEGMARDHSVRLLAQHSSSLQVEIWRGAKLVSEVSRSLAQADGPKADNDVPVQYKRIGLSARISDMKAARRRSLMNPPRLDADVSGSNAALASAAGPARDSSPERLFGIAKRAKNTST